MKKKDVVDSILKKKSFSIPLLFASVFSPSNIALCKYWGKSNEELNIPQNSSLSVSLGSLGSTVTIKKSEEEHDQVIFNRKILLKDDAFVVRLCEFLNLFRPSPDFFFHVETASNIPLAAGLASSAAGFSALVLALDKFFAWQLDAKDLSILARLGSGSACRSLWQGFVDWQKGEDSNGMDCYGKPFSIIWQEFRVGVLLISDKSKSISSRLAMKKTLLSPVYPEWLEKAEKDYKRIKEAVLKQNFIELGEVAESNALAMHSLLQTVSPPIVYSLHETLLAQKQVVALRNSGTNIYFTQDAGANLKLLFLSESEEVIKNYFPQIIIAKPFECF